MMKLTVVTLVAIGCLIESVEPCTDDIVKQMAVSVCGLSKRSFSADNGWSIFGPLGRIFRLNFSRISDIQREYRQLIGDFDEAELLFKVSDRKKTKEPNVVRHRPRHWSTYGVKTNVGTDPISESRMISRDDVVFGEVYLGMILFPDNDDGGHSSVKKRDIVTLVKECCYRKCTVDDFKGICDKK